MPVLHAALDRTPRKPVSGGFQLTHHRRVTGEDARDISAEAGRATDQLVAQDVLDDARGLLSCRVAGAVELLVEDLL